MIPVVERGSPFGVLDNPGQFDSSAFDSAAEMYPNNPDKMERSSCEFVDWEYCGNEECREDMSECINSPCYKSCCIASDLRELQITSPPDHCVTSPEKGAPMIGPQSVPLDPVTR